ncbi:MAG: DEAD/DEAH box helicase family protein [Mycoplasma sp.]|nr:DEAD/DEAH box helicase family protein [Mycoplasma sp.]
MKLFKGQEQAVEKLTNLFEQGVKKIDFKSPTGSGKTFMAASLISNICNLEQKVVFLVGTLSSSNLPLQFKNKLDNYNKYLPGKFTTEIITSPSNDVLKKVDKEYRIFAENKKVIIFGKSSFGRGKILTETNTIDVFIDQVKNEGYKLIYIRDEAHIGLKEEKGIVTEEKISKSLQEEKTIINAADFVLKMTATPDGHSEQVVVREQDLFDDKQSLLKRKDKFNKNIKQLDKNEIDDYELLDIALNEFVKIKKEYNKFAPNINPAALIQISSLSENLSYDDLTKEVEIYKKQIESHGLTWATYYGDKKEMSTLEEANLNSISLPNSSVDVVIFKVGPATGWDIPRACMLIQLRNVSSDTLNKQTLGRIKRNPINNLEIMDFSDKYYVYSNYQEPARDLFQYKLVDKYDDIKIPIIIAKEDGDVNFKTLSHYRTILKEFLNNKAVNIKQKIIEEFTNEKQYVAFKKRRYIDNNTKEAQIKVERKVFNAIQLKIEVLNELEKLGNIWQNSNQIIKDFFKENVNKTLNGITYIQYLFIIQRDFIGDINDLYIREYGGKASYNYYFKDNAKLKKNYMIWGNKAKNGESDLNLLDFEKVKDNYAYINTDKFKKYKQALDSAPERIFMETVINTMFNNKISFDLWSKNPSLGNEVYLEYINKNGDISKSFIDFIFIKENKFLYVEVKGTRDYDEEKTNKIINAYKKYRKDITKNKIGQMYFAVAKVDAEKYGETKTSNRLNFKIEYKSDNVDLNNKKLNIEELINHTIK